MRADLSGMKALVFGGTGAVGSTVLRGLAQAGISTAFTYHRSIEKAQTLAAELAQRALVVDLGEPEAVRRLLQELEAEGFHPNVFIHCAAMNQSLTLGQITEADWEKMQKVNGYSAFLACQALAPKMAQRGEGHLVLVGALNRTQSFPAPAHFAASQGLLSTMVMALAKELGSKGIRINMVALGLLEEGLSEAMTTEQVSEYKAFSALRRAGTPEEAAQAILWLALENTYMNGEVLTVNGGV